MVDVSDVVLELGVAAPASGAGSTMAVGVEGSVVEVDDAPGVAVGAVGSSLVHADATSRHPTQNRRKPNDSKHFPPHNLPSTYQHDPGRCIAGVMCIRSDAHTRRYTRSG